MVSLWRLKRMEGNPGSSKDVAALWHKHQCSEAKGEYTAQGAGCMRIMT